MPEFALKIRFVDLQTSITVLQPSLFSKL